MLTIKKSDLDKLDYDFHKAVDEYAAAMNAHTKEESVAAPGAASDLVERAVLRTKAHGRADLFVPHYAIEDDTPPVSAPITLEQKKTALEAKLRECANDIAAEISPRRKQMFLHMAVQQVNSIPDAGRTAEHKMVLSLHEKMSKRMETLNWYLAHQLNHIDNLTDDNVDAYVLEPFKPE